MKTVLTTLHSKYIHNSLALPCIAAYCGAAAGDIVIREYTMHEPKESVASAILAEKPDVVAFSVYLWNRRETLELIDLLSVARPGLKLVVGGPEVSFDGPELFADHPGLTALVRGEGEKPMRELLEAWQRNRRPPDIPRLALRCGREIREGDDAHPLAELDKIPSPFKQGLVDPSRGFVYYETSRGCPYTCSFCMSALDDSVRSYSIERIRSDLLWLIENEVDKVKLVDRTFNYDAKRARDIFRFILEHNRGSHFHFEIGAHLLDEPTLELLEQVPAGMFHFEIGVQSTLPETLSAIERKVSLQRVLENIEKLRERTAIELHLDLIAGLPGEDYHHFLASVDSVLALRPDHLQIEPVKLLPGSPLRSSARMQNLRYDPNPPYTVLATPHLSYDDLENLKSISRLLDLTWNSGRLRNFLQVLAEHCGSISGALERLALDLQSKQLFRQPMSQTGLFMAIWTFIQEKFEGREFLRLRDHLSRDYALCERVIPARAPDFFETALSDNERETVREIVKQRQRELSGRKTRLQYFAAVFSQLDVRAERQVRLYLYLTRTGEGQKVEEIPLPVKPEPA